MRRGGITNTGYPRASLSRRKAEIALTGLLYFCTDERLAGFTAEGLAASYNVEPERAGVLLDGALKARSA